jgi:hypothetical protein
MTRAHKFFDALYMGKVRSAHPTHYIYMGKVRAAHPTDGIFWRYSSKN